MTQANALRVLVVDDSAVTRRLLMDALSGHAGIEVVGHASNGELSLKQIARLRPDVVTLDIEMPEMDGIETLKHIREQFPATRVVMFSSVTGTGAPATLKALMHGANDYCPKPLDFRSVEESREYLRRELIPKIRQFAKGADAVPRRRLVSTEPAIARENAPPLQRFGSARKAGPMAAVVIGISTGGPQSLGAILPTIPGNFHLPILIVQHMPASFTGLLAQRLNTESPLAIEEAKDGQLVRPGLALLAPGGRHLRLARKGTDVAVALDSGPAENSCRPAVDVLFRSAAEIWGGHVLAAILTGMGQDGLRGAQALKALGASVIAQDEQSSIVWGMPGSVVNAGLADEVLDLGQIVPAILKRTGYRS